MKVSFMGSGYVCMPTIVEAASKLFDLPGIDVNSRTAKTTNKGNICKVEPESEHFVKQIGALGKQKVPAAPSHPGVWLIDVHVLFKQNHCSGISSEESAKRNSIPLFTSLVYTTKRIANHIWKGHPELPVPKFITCCVKCKLTENLSAFVQRTFADAAYPKILKALKENEKAAFSVAA